MKNMKAWIVAAGCGVALMTVLGGCKAGGGKAAAADGNGAQAAPGMAEVGAPVKPQFRYKVVVDQANFYRLGPMQAGGPDGQLKKDLRITFVKRFGGYSQVEANGATVYVASDQVAQISAQESAAEDAATLAQQAPPNALAPTIPGPGGTYSIPPEATRDTVLPTSDATPKPTPNGMFRY